MFTFVMHAAFPTHIILLNFMAAAKSAALQTNGMVHDLSVCLCFWQSLAATWRIPQQIFTAKSHPEKIYANIFHLRLFLWLLSFLAQQLISGIGCLVVEIPRSHTTRHTNTHTHTHTAGSTPLDEWSARRVCVTYTKHNIHNRQISIPSAGFEPAIPAT